MSRYYSYSPLPDGFIRLLQIHPAESTQIHHHGPATETIEVSMIVTSLTAAPTYDALSYTWGDPTPEPNATMRQFTKVSRCFPVVCGKRILLGTRNLRDALLQLREWISREMQAQISRQGLEEYSCRFSQYIWIDALCINQDDIAERNKQVSMMASIYATAKQVIGWLGSSDETVKGANVVISALCEAPDDKFDNVDNDFDFDNPKSFEACGIANINKKYWVDFAVFMNRNWFKRIWVMQEILLAKDIVCICGRTLVNMSRVFRAVSYILAARWHRQLGELVDDAIFTRGTVSQHQTNAVEIHRYTRLHDLSRMRVKYANGGAPSLLESLYLNYYTDATDPKDRVFALLSLTAKAEELPVGYNKSASEVFVDATKYIIESCEDALILSLRQDTSLIKIKDLPSWCPDYSTLSNAPQPFRSSDGLDGWSAAGKLRWPVGPPNVLGRQLHLSGRQVGRVLDTAPSLYMMLDRTEDLNERLLQILNLVLDAESDLAKTRLKSNVCSLDQLIASFQTQNYRCEKRTSADTMKIIGNYLTYIIAIQFSGYTPSEKDDFLNSCFVKIQSKFKSLSTFQPVYNYVCSSLSLLFQVLDYYRACYVADKKQLSEILERLMGYEEKSQCDAFTWDMCVFSQNRCVVRISNGFVGIAHEAVLPSDEFWLIDGAVVPFILRRLNTGHYTLVGEAYIKGMMYGEALEWAEEIKGIVIQ